MTILLFYTFMKWKYGDNYEKWWGGSKNTSLKSPDSYGLPFLDLSGELLTGMKGLVSRAKSFTK